MHYLPGDLRRNNISAHVARGAIRRFPSHDARSDQSTPGIVGKATLLNNKSATLALYMSYSCASGIQLLSRNALVPFPSDTLVLESELAMARPSILKMMVATQVLCYCARASPQSMTEHVLVAEKINALPEDLKALLPKHCRILGTTDGVRPAVSFVVEEEYPGTTTINFIQSVLAKRKWQAITFDDANKIDITPQWIELGPRGKRPHLRWQGVWSQGGQNDAEMFIIITELHGTIGKMGRPLLRVSAFMDATTDP